MTHGEGATPAPARQTTRWADSNGSAADRHPLSRSPNNSMTKPNGTFTHVQMVEMSISRSVPPAWSLAFIIQGRHCAPRMARERFKHRATSPHPQTLSITCEYVGKQQGESRYMPSRAALPGSVAALACSFRSSRSRAAAASFS